MLEAAHGRAYHDEACADALARPPPHRLGPRRYSPAEEIASRGNAAASRGNAAASRGNAAAGSTGHAWRLRQASAKASPLAAEKMLSTARRTRASGAIALSAAERRQVSDHARALQHSAAQRSATAAVAAAAAARGGEQRPSSPWHFLLCALHSLLGCDRLLLGCEQQQPCASAKGGGLPRVASASSIRRVESIPEEIDLEPCPD